jgi:UDP-glucose:glycoprotein glucosyltransferase
MITEDEDVSTYFYDLPTTYKRRNEFIFPTETKPLQIVDLKESFRGLDSLLEEDKFVHPSFGKHIILT